MYFIIILGTSLFITTNLLFNKSENKNAREKSYNYQLHIMDSEKDNKIDMITKDTCSFEKYIANIIYANNQTIPNINIKDKYNDLNQLLVLVNDNYEKIMATSRQEMTREELITEVIERAMQTLDSDALDKLNIFKVHDILTSCPHINSELSHKIIKTFATSKIKYLDQKVHAVKDIDYEKRTKILTEHKKLNSFMSERGYFDHLDDSHYLVVIKYLTNQIPGAEKLKWNIPFLKFMTSTIFSKFADDLEKTDQNDDLKFVTSFTNYVANSCLDQSITNISSVKMLLLFQKWDYFNEQLMSDIYNYINDTYDFYDDTKKTNFFLPGSDVLKSDEQLWREVQKEMKVEIRGKVYAKQRK